MFRAKVITARIQVLEDVSKGMSIMPLIEAGEFSTISESLTEADIEIREGRFADYVSKLVDKIPGGMKTAARNFMVTKDTQLFNVLNRP